MSIALLDAAFKCRIFKGAARLLLLALANRASTGEPRKDGKIVPIGWSYAGGGRLMSDINASRDTVIDAMRILVAAGVVQRRRRLGSASWSFVDIEVLRAHAYTEEDMAEFRRKWKAKVGKSTTTGQSEKEKSLPLKGGNSTTTNVGKSTLTDVGEIPTSVSGNSPPYNPKIEPQGSNAKVVETSDSESELTDADSDDRGQVTSLSNSSSEEDAQDSLSDLDVDEYPDISIPLSDRAVVPPDPEEYATTVYLCSLFWATHNLPTPIEGPSPEPPLEHPWGHPRTWEPWQQRDRFRTMMDPSWESEWEKVNPNRRASPSEEESEEQVAGDSPDYSEAEEKAFLADEEAMLSLYLEHGKDTVEEVLRWLPASRWYYNPDAELDTIADLCRKWQYVSAECDRYLDKAADSGTEDHCQDWIDQKFNAAGGDNAKFICYDRLNPVDPRDAAEEEAADIFDDEFGVDVFNPWAEQDLEDSLAAAQGKKTIDAVFNCWAEADAGAPAGDSATAPANESDEVGDAEPEPPVACLCKDCGSAHGGTCVPDVDLE